MGLVAGPGKAPIAATTMRSDTSAEINRGRLRGWVLVGAVGAYLLALFAWPELPATIGLVVLGSVLVVVALWPRRALPDAERSPREG